MMNFISWNCRSTTANGFTMMVKDIRRNYHASLMFLLETHASGNAAERRIRKLGFSGTFWVDSVGQAGGIWCLWDDTVWTIDVLESTSQLVHMKVSWKG